MIHQSYPFIPRWRADAPCARFVATRIDMPCACGFYAREHYTIWTAITGEVTDE